MVRGSGSGPRKAKMTTKNKKIRSSMFCLRFLRPEAEFFGEIQSKVLRVFLPAVQSHLYGFALRLFFFKSTQPLLQFITVHCKGERRKT
jgi:hypothetical protein